MENESHCASGRGQGKITLSLLLSSVAITTPHDVHPPPIVALSTTHTPLDDITTTVATTFSSSPHLLSLQRQTPSLVATSAMTLLLLLFPTSSQQPPPHCHITVSIFAKNDTAALLFALGMSFPTAAVAPCPPHPRTLPYTPPPQQHVDCHFPCHCHGHSP